ncbi:hypothetical protein JTE90_007998 [Oedothorax gibbosus]|uniref:Dynein regulatory complex protein 9 n=1 Tax=Oedothorax gibbosus TaxID=931172 RepID=A0AAV6UVC9_9ARAC|nr:hypothetical protein JTE90_007998 [Oedothorax gibbosus]
MNSKKLKSNDVKIILGILRRLEERLYLLRVSICDTEGIKSLKDRLLQIYSDSDFGDKTELLPQLECKERNVVLDCCDIEIALGNVLHELTQRGTFKSLFEFVQDKEGIYENFGKRQNLLNTKREQVEELKRQLSTLGKQSNSTVLLQQDKSIFSVRETNSEENISYLKQLLKERIKSKKEYYEHLFKEINEKREELQREVEMQNHANIQIFSSSLLRFEEQVESLDEELRKTFDDLAMKKREVAVLKKYKRFNLEKLEMVTKEISIRKEVIEKDKHEKEMERQRLEEERKKNNAATLIQAQWRGTMVRKYLGPFKKLKKKKRKKGKKRK